MVFLSAVNFGRKVKSGASKFWKRQRIFQISANFYGRRRNCYRLAIRSVQKALIHSQEGRQARRDELHRIWKIRTEAASLEHGISYEPFYINLAKCRLALDRHMLADLAYTEPRTFKGLATLARFMRSIEAVDETSALQERPEGVITRGML
ncbi:50S ribosomal protein L20 [Rhipicephalus sanguineus]|uniref:50S ribosomal protein L20 n=1 Tax=Rhipicephalus sanguineus TaxID=34632 RepID=UPI0018960E44|nr:50S ribosomal protein L20 [Rhipicephalus sanguineus]